MKLTREIEVFDPSVFVPFKFYYIRHNRFEALCSCKEVRGCEAIFTIICPFDMMNVYNITGTINIPIEEQRDIFYDSCTFRIDGKNYHGFLTIEQMECMTGMDIETGTPIMRIAIDKARCIRMIQSERQKISLRKD